MSPFTDDVHLTITPCYPSISMCLCPAVFLFLPSQSMIRLKRRTRYAARQQRLSRGTLSCRALMDMRLAALSEQHARFQAFLGGTLPLPLITQRYLAGQNTPCKYRRFESASAESHEIRRMVWVRGKAHKPSIKAARQIVPRKGEMLQGISCPSF